MEAGGHIGKLTTMALVPAKLLRHLSCAIGAGGVADGRGMGCCSYAWSRSSVY